MKLRLATELLRTWGLTIPQGFSTLALGTFGAREFSVGEEEYYPVYCKMFSSIPGGQ